MMPFPQNTIPRIWTLTNAFCESTISEQELHELELLLEADPNAKEFYIDFLNINADISWLISAKKHSAMDLGPRSLVDSLVAPPKRSPILGFLGDWANLFNQHSPLSFVLLFTILGVALFATSYWLAAPHSGQVSAESAFVAQITVAKDCQWSTTVTPPTGTMQLQLGQQLRLEKGMAQITYYNGAVVLLEGPASFTLDSPKSGFLSRGQLTARADSEQSRQFAILTPQARFVDLGTEFGVMIDAKGRAAVAVFAGQVKAEAKLANGRWSAPVAIHKGEAVVCEGAKFTPQVALRSDFPTLLPPPPQRHPSYQRWLDASRELQGRQDLLAYYDFQPDPNNPTVLLNRASTGAVFNGEIQNATWVDGRFPGKSALEFKKAKSGVKINLPQEMPSATLAAWVNIESLPNNLNSLLTSDGWKKPFAVHWRLKRDGLVTIAIQNQAGSLLHGLGDQVSAKPGEWIYPIDHFNRWCMLVTVYDLANKQVLCYFNGNKVSTKSLNQSPLVKFGPAMIGGWNPAEETDDLERTLDGRMDELMIFQKALTAEEIKQIYEAGKP